MTKRADIAVDREIAAEASAWVAQIESGDLTSADLAALREWIARSPGHARAIGEFAAMSAELSMLTDLAEPLAAAAAADSGWRRPRRSVRPWLWVGLWAAAGALALAVGLPLALTALRLGEPAPVEVAQGPEAYDTAVGEYLTVTLSDGSVVQLNTDTRLEVAFDESARRVRLLQGEALFDVAPDPDWRFIVLAGETVSEAVGTSFVLRLYEEAAELSVVEGVVAFSRAEEAGQVAAAVTALSIEPLLVRRGQSLLSSALPAEAGAVTLAALPETAPREIQRKLSWTEGLFDFSDTPLEDVVAELSRHNPVTVEFADPELRELEFGGIFRVGDIDPLLEALSGLGVEIERPRENYILLRKAVD